MVPRLCILCVYFDMRVVVEYHDSGVGDLRGQHIIVHQPIDNFSRGFAVFLNLISPRVVGVDSQAVNCNNTVVLSGAITEGLDQKT